MRSQSTEEPLKLKLLNALTAIGCIALAQPTSADAMLATSYLSFGSVPEWKGVEITYARRAKCDTAGR